MNNIRNNRRRGRGNRNQSGGGNAGNRIDSRARGNAPQLLDKYKKLAQDAQHNGDRVQQEYYLQFADHYFRVIAGNKARQDEVRGKRSDGRDSSDDDDDSDDDGEDRRGGGNNRRARGRRDDRDEGPGGRNTSPDRSDRSDSDDDEGERYEPEDNPFVREEKPKKRAVRQKDNGGSEIDAAALPPSIGAGEDGGANKPAPRRRRKSSDDGDGDTLSAVG
ncbi:MAG: DUF4167 domain-containing protein [Qipengyuania sp.]